MLPDNRLRFPTSLIDFVDDVGMSGQDHEKFPAADAQPRWDWLLMYFMSILSNQSSYEEPTQYRDGTLWFDLNTLTLKVWRSSIDEITGSWMSIAGSIELETIAGNTTTLKSWYDSADAKLTGSSPVLTFSGYVTSSYATTINIPTSLQSSIDLSKTRPFLYINGLLVDPRDCEYYTNTTIKLINSTQLVSGDKFTVVIQNILSANFSTPDVIV